MSPDIILDPSHDMVHRRKSQKDLLKDAVKVQSELEREEEALRLKKSHLNHYMHTLEQEENISIPQSTPPIPNSTPPIPNSTPEIPTNASHVSVPQQAVLNTPKPTLQETLNEQRKSLVHTQASATSTKEGSFHKELGEKRGSLHHLSKFDKELSSKHLKKKPPSVKLRKTKTNPRKKNQSVVDGIVHQLEDAMHDRRALMRFEEEDLVLVPEDQAEWE